MKTFCELLLLEKKWAYGHKVEIKVQSSKMETSHLSTTKKASSSEIPYNGFPWLESIICHEFFSRNETINRFCYAEMVVKG